MSTYRIPCGCTFQRLSENVEHVLKLCDCCAKEFGEQREDDQRRHAEARAKLNGVPA